MAVRPPPRVAVAFLALGVANAVAAILSPWWRQALVTLARAVGVPL